MVKNIDSAINYGLDFISKTDHNCIEYDDFQYSDDSYKNSYQVLENKKVLLKEMESLGLVKIYGSEINLTALGERIFNNGGWINHLKKIKQNRTRDQNLQRMFWICAGLSLLLSIYNLVSK